MKLHENKKLYTDAIRFTAQKMNLKPEFVEKDYWVTYTLFTIFNNEIGKDTVFKGGTALSKCHDIIERFSEDIDLVVFRYEGETNSKLKAKLKAVSSLIETIMPEIFIEGITQKLGMNRKTAHSYNKEFYGDYGQVRDVIVLETTWLGYYEPYSTQSIVSFLGKMMVEEQQTDIAREYGLMPFNVLALQPIRTICEKIMSLVRFSYSDNPLEDLKNKIRHAYDLHLLLKKRDLFDFFNSDAFEKMLLKVAIDDVLSYKNKNIWLIHHPNESLIYKDLDNVWEILKVTYNTDFKALVYGELPKESDILKTLKMIRERMRRIQWKIEL